ncbi:hypothetical protein Deipr_2308 (plasmid) [Deinococcus proteolyticus MRP]|uniref:Uncharacterized protein n=1 Tax=Deinococcus proteolyticus (strain ATCC 35074 / DSM 20540 / JCM 6276 / NBRC 101906 / NCIMB 13154 / VKM Ac-1939 / CCM 2703 / MRP) TaxID=693977 RepID=F0RQ74_DEIPM|nr:hypothetical protein [Deinococcus proteolyticus]ADY27433.1 hypothetical protein Deipr_2308 [Deinococcus proteolyticus MRP]
MNFEFQGQDFRTYIYSSGETTLEITCDMQGERERIVLAQPGQVALRYHEERGFWYDFKGLAVEVPASISEAALKVAFTHH